MFKKWYFWALYIVNTFLNYFSYPTFPTTIWEHMGILLASFTFLLFWASIIWLGKKAFKKKKNS